MLTAILIGIGVILATLLLIGVIIWVIRAIRFKPNRNKIVQCDALNDNIEELGFAYDLKNNCFYSLMDCWQREMGYCRLYDEAAPYVNLIINSEPISFEYEGKRWLIEFWKGQYGITTGAEIGVYNTEEDDIDTDTFKGTFYQAVEDSERLHMSYVLRRDGKVLLRRKDYHWWLTGFLLGEFSKPESLVMDIKIKFSDKKMATAYYDALRDAGYEKKECSKIGVTVKVTFTKPHIPMENCNKVQEKLALNVNRMNTKLFNKVTSKYSCTLDKLEFLSEMMPELYNLVIHSIYWKGLYDTFEWLIEIIMKHDHDHKPPKPCPPEPCPPEPCPPELCQPCPPEPCPPCPPEPCQPCPPEPCQPCPPEPCQPCPPEPCQPCPPKSCVSGSCPVRSQKSCQSESCKRESSEQEYMPNISCSTELPFQSYQPRQSYRSRRSSQMDSRQVQSEGQSNYSMEFNMNNRQPYQNRRMNRNRYANMNDMYNANMQSDESTRNR